MTREAGDEDGATIDGALWSCALLNELRLQLPLLATIPAKGFARLRMLHTVSITHTALVMLPVEITFLDELKSLELSDNALTTLPAVADGKSAQDAWAHGGAADYRYILCANLFLIMNVISDLTCTAGKLKKLEGLDVRRNKLTSFDAFVFPLTNLVTIYADDNALISIDALNFEKLKRLKSITASNNALTEVPEVIATLKGLETLKLQNNQITDLCPLPKKLQELLMEGNPLKEAKLRKLVTAASRGARELKTLLKHLEKGSKKKGKGGKKGGKRVRKRPAVVKPPPPPSSESESEEEPAPAVAAAAPAPAKAAAAVPRVAAAESSSRTGSRYGGAFDDMSSAMGIDDSLSGGQMSGDRAAGGSGSGSSASGSSASAGGAYAAWGEDVGAPTDVSHCFVLFCVCFAPFLFCLLILFAPL